MGRYHKGRRRAQRPRGWSRREFLAGTTAAGIVAGLPPWLIGCGSDDDAPRPGATPTPTAIPTPVPGLREDCTLHFDLSDTGLEDLEIHAFGSEDDGVRLQMHDGESRAHFRNENPALVEVADEDLTHFIEDVSLPSDALQLYWVTGCLENGEDALAGMNVHVPERVLMALAESAAARGRRHVRSAKMRHYGIGAQGQNLMDLYPNVASFVSIFDTATALLFQQQELLNINLEQGASILELIQSLPCSENDPNCLPFIDTLAFRIANAWPATESGMVEVGGRMVQAWARVVPVIGVDGQPVLDSEGNPSMSYDVSDEIARTALSTAHEIRNFILNSAEFEGFNWHPTRGRTTDEQQVGQASSRSRVFVSGLQGGTPQVQVVGEHAQGTTTYGLEFTRIAIVDQGKRTVEIEVRNHYVRFVSAFVRFANEAGDLPLTPGDQNTQRSQFVRLVNPNYTVFGVPLLGDLVERQTFRFDIPTDATKARLILGSLGVGGEAFSPEALPASVATLGFNIGIPTLLLATGAVAGGVLQKSITGFLQSPGGRTALTLMIVRCIALAGPSVANGIYGTKNSGNATPVLASLGSAMVSIITSADEFSAIAIQIGLVFISNRVGDIALPLSWAFKAAALAADAATLAQTIAEVLASPAVFTNTLSLQMRTRVTIVKDPRNATFPARARHYEVTLTYDQASKVAHKMTGTIEAGREEEIEVVFDAVPSGGNVSVEVILRSDDDWIAGGSTGADGELGPVGPIPNNPQMAGEIEITIKEQLVPITAQTRFEHLRKLEYRSGAHTWVAGAPAPTATRADLCQGQDDRLCNLVGITISQRTGNLGYGFQAGGQGVSFCGEASGGVMYLIQNISVAAGNDRNLKQLPCGFRQPAGIIYDRLGPANGIGRNFFVRPTADGFFVQSIRLDATTPFDLTTPLSWGRFSQPMDSLALHPMGYVVGVNRNTHKMEILQLPAAAVDSSQAPDAIPFAVQKAGEGDRAGLLSVPVAVTVFEGAILVLEAGNRRVQAFDVSGNPVNLFAGGTQSAFPLTQGDLTYLDLGVDGLGYVYALAYVGSGANVSDYRLDVYTPEGQFLTRTEGLAAARLTVDTFRSVYTLNYETLAGAPRVEPSLSHWVPSTPVG
jgi:hypothetical protein